MNHLSKLDAIRGLAASLVAVHHYSALAGSDFSIYFHNFYLFVDFFFVLSGYIIATAYFNRLSSVEDGMRFMTLRLARIYPLHVVIIIGFALLEIIRVVVSPLLGITLDAVAFEAANMSPQALSLHLLLLNGMGILDTPSWNYPAWSISVEFYTYGCFAVVMMTPLLARLRLSPLFWGAAGMLALVSLMFCSTSINVYADYAMLRCLSGFAFGVALQRLLASRGNGLEPRRGLRAGVMEVLAVGFCIGYIALTDDARSFYAPVIFTILIGIFVLHEGWISKLMRHWTLMALGRWSFGIYMVHALLLHPLTILTRRFNGEAVSQALVWGTPVFVALTIFAAALSYRFIEAPMRDYVRNKLDARQARKSHMLHAS